MKLITDFAITKFLFKNSKKLLTNKIIKILDNNIDISLRVRYNFCNVMLLAKSVWNSLHLN